jgi:lipoprotein-anchoring transpeptidase ErfK/SrfK
LLVVAATLVVAACGSSDREAVSPPAPAPPTAQPPAPPPPEPSAPAAPNPPAQPAPTLEPKRCLAGAREPLGDLQVAYAAHARGPVNAFGRPGGKVIERFDSVNVNGYPTVFGVLGVVVDETCEPAWYRVQLPIRPNGATGYVRANKVSLRKVETRIEVDLSARRIDVFRLGKRVMRLETAIGAAQTPTPTGSYYVNQLLAAKNERGPWGPGGIGISAFSPVLVDWPQGGPIAIHGTNVPSSIGQPTSNGCMRVDNESVRRLFKLIHAGTPVVIEA